MRLMGDSFFANKDICEYAAIEVDRRHNGFISQPSYYNAFMNGVAHPILAALCGSDDGDMYVRLLQGDYYVYYEQAAQQASC